MSEFDPSYQPPYEKPVSQQGMSGCSKAAIAVAILMVLAFAVCCVGGAIFLRQSFTADPQRISDIGDKVLTWDGNSKFPPLGGVDVFLARVAVFGDSDTGFIFVADSRLGNSEMTGRQFDGQIKAQLGSKFEETETIERENREIAVRGSPLHFQFNQTRGKDSDRLYWEVAGVVQGNEFPTFVFLRLVQDQYSDEDIHSLIESIR